jgi:LPS-assembly protein
VTTPSKIKGLDNIPVYINALKFSGAYNRYIYKGGVDLVQGNKYLAADSLTYYKLKNIVKAQGNVNFINGDLTLYANSIQSDLKAAKKER